MKTILFLHHASSIGGGSFCLLNILRNIDLTYITPLVLLQTDGPLVDEIKKLNIEVLFMPSMSVVPYNQSLLNIKSILTWIKVKRSLRDFREILSKHSYIDVVYLNNMMLHPYLEIAKKMGMKCILHCREHWPLDENRLQLRWAQQNTRKYADRVIAINQYSASMFEDCKDFTTIVYDWIDMKSRYTPIDLAHLVGQDPSNIKIVLFTGGSFRIKGALETVRAFKTAFKSDEYRLLMLGVVENPIGKARGTKKVIKNFLKFFGVMSYPDQVWNEIKDDKRIICIPSRYDIAYLMENAFCMLNYFNIPHANLALAESITMKTPSVVAKTEESIEYSNNGELAKLFKFRNYEDFLKSIRDLQRDYDILKNELNNNSFLIEQMFSKEANCQKLNYVLYNI